MLYWLHGVTPDVTHYQGLEPMSNQNCEMCNKPMHPFSKQSTCGAACRMKKSRLKANSYQIAIDAKQGIKTLIKGLELNILSAGDIYDDYLQFQQVMHDLEKAIYARDDRERQIREQDAAKTRK